MNKNNELKIFIDNYIIFNGTENLPRNLLTNNSTETNNVYSKIKELTFSDHPDGYFYDEKCNILYIFEHFELDSSEKNENGSLYRRSASKVRKEQNKKTAMISDEFIKNIGIIEQKHSSDCNYNMGENGAEYRENYIKNFEIIFQKHCNQIDNYKKECVLKLQKKNNLMIQSSCKFMIVFVFEDVTFGGTKYLLRNGKSTKPGCVVNPLYTKQFMKFLKDSEVDYLIFDSQYDKEMLTILDKKYVTESTLKQAIDLDKYEFYVMPAIMSLNLCKTSKIEL